MPDPAAIIQPINSTLRWLVIATVALAIALGGIAVWTYIEAGKSHDSARNNRAALCALRGDLEKRVETSKAFLRENPKGIPGISAATIQQGINNQESTIDALSDLSC